MRNKTKWIILLVPIFLSGCASYKSHILLGMGLAGTTGAVIGGIAAPRNENSTGHALLYGGISAALAGAIGVLAFDDSETTNKLKSENELLKKTLNAGQSLDSTYETMGSSNALFGKEMPSEYRKLIRPGRWSIFKIDQWVSEGENTLIHRDKMIQLEPPILNPGNSKEGQK